MKDQAVAVQSRGRLVGISAEFLHAARELAIRRAARDAHRSECQSDALECNVCRVHATRIADAKAALRSDAFS